MTPNVLKRHNFLIEQQMTPAKRRRAIWQILPLRESGHRKITRYLAAGWEFAEGTAIQAAKSLLQLFERIEDLSPVRLKSRSLPVTKPMPAGGSRNVAVFGRHGLTILVEYSLLVRPNVGH